VPFYRLRQSSEIIMWMELYFICRNIKNNLSVRKVHNRFVFAKFTNENEFNNFCTLLTLGTFWHSGLLISFCYKKVIIVCDFILRMKPISIPKEQQWRTRILYCFISPPPNPPRRSHRVGKSSSKLECAGWSKWKNGSKASNDKEQGCIL